jgi:hypothetical protein
MRKRKKLASSLQRFLHKTNFNFTSIPAVGGGGASLVGTLQTLNDVRQRTKAAQQTAVTACDIARSVCKPVDDLMRSGVRPQMGYYSPQTPYWASQSAFPYQSTGGLVQAAQAGISAGTNATRLVADQVIETLADGLPSGA